LPSRLFPMDAVQEQPDRALKRELEIPSRGRNLAKVRAFVEKVAVECEFNDSEVFEIKVAVGEACANAIEHGSPAGGADRVRVVCEYAEKCLEIEVIDEGLFKPRFPAFDSQLNYRGRGIPFMLALMDEVEIKESDEGTTVRLVKCRT